MPLAIYLPTMSVKRFPFLHALSCISGFYTLWGCPFWLMQSDTSVLCWFAARNCLVGQKGIRVFPEYIQEKRIRPLWPMTSLKKFCPCPCAFEARQNALLKSRSHNSALLSSSFSWLTSRHFSMLGIIFNPAGLWIAVPEPQFSICFFGIWPQNSRIASRPILVPRASWAFGQFLFLIGN